jgi:GntR family transcriptional regulator
MRFRVDSHSGQAIYLQLMEQVRHAVETGVLREGDMLPGIRGLAEELVISHNTVVKAYTALAQEGLLELRHGSGAYICGRRPTRLAEKTRLAQEDVAGLVRGLRARGFANDEIRRMFEAELLVHAGRVAR